MKRKSISATALASLGKCENSFALGQRYPTQHSQEATEQMREGEKLHLQMQQSVTDRRCFVASFAFGIDAPQTQLLRSFRDRHLKPYAMGRLFITLYYTLSPALVLIARRIPFGKYLVRTALQPLISYLARKSQ